MKNCITSEYSSDLIGKIKLSTNDVIKVFTKLYLPDGLLNPSVIYSKLDVFTEFAQIIQKDKKDIINKFNKTLLISKILKHE